MIRKVLQILENSENYESSETDEEEREDEGEFTQLEEQKLESPQTIRRKSDQIITLDAPNCVP